MQYRAEVDGLRALAVVPVILFHAGVETLSGGFIGVDVFFVISGFLITSILLQDIQQQRFSLLDFYERRARRILPALFVVLLVCLPFSWAWLMPAEYADFSLSLISVPLFSSNFQFWQESGYFQSTAELKPLLHTWSLAVEEQYYVLFPLLLLLFRRCRERWLWLVIGCIALASLALAKWGVEHKPEAAFYLLVSRAWELMAGAVLAGIMQTQLMQKWRANSASPVTKLGANLLASLGLLLIVVPIFFYDEHTPFPGPHALVPVRLADHCLCAPAHLGGQVAVQQGCGGHWADQLQPVSLASTDPGAGQISSGG